ncbi:MAG: hypothetical protein FWC38_08015, partial [Proteobacteria bacterium]|nr:hypothetical protein [Pseudomonadota bacterium]MCL2308146.1 hypothetical protein [Pseudomonadota bacterium]
AIQRFFRRTPFLDCFASLAMTAFFIHAKARSREDIEHATHVCRHSHGSGNPGKNLTKKENVCFTDAKVGKFEN